MAALPFLVLVREKLSKCLGIFDRAAVLGAKDFYGIGPTS